MSWEEVCHFIAQGAINIDSGLTTIEKNSQVHKAMHAFCDFMTEENGRAQVRLALETPMRSLKGGK